MGGPVRHRGFQPLRHNYIVTSQDKTVVFCARIPLLRYSLVTCSYKRSLRAADSRITAALFNGLKQVDTRECDSLQDGQAIRQASSSCPIGSFRVALNH